MGIHSNDHICIVEGKHINPFLDEFCGLFLYFIVNALGQDENVKGKV